MHLIYAGEKVRPHEALPNPDVTESERGERFTVLALPALVRIKLTALRDKDRTHLRDLIEVGLLGSGDPAGGGIGSPGIARWGVIICPADYNADGVTNSRDFFAFLTAFFAGSADFNGSGATDSQDFFDFLSAFFVPC